MHPLGCSACVLNVLAKFGSDGSTAEKAQDTPVYIYIYFLHTIVSKFNIAGSTAETAPGAPVMDTKQCFARQ